jgi:hypothetical protein
MIETQYLNVLRKIYNRLIDNQVNWVITGSLGMALQGMDVKVHDIDIQTNKDGAYDLEGIFREYQVKPVSYSQSERIRSYLGMLEIDGIKIEIMGDIQKLLDDNMWEEPVMVENHRCWVENYEMRIPVLSMEYEYQAYLELGRNEKAEMIRKWLQKTKAG